MDAGGGPFVHWFAGRFRVADRYEVEGDEFAVESQDFGGGSYAVFVGINAGPNAP